MKGHEESSKYAVPASAYHHVDHHEEMEEARQKIMDLENIVTAYVPRGPGGNAGMALTIGELHRRLERGRAAQLELGRLRSVLGDLCAAAEKVLDGFPIGHWSAAEDALQAVVVKARRVMKEGT